MDLDLRDSDRPVSEIVDLDRVDLVPRLEAQAVDSGRVLEVERDPTVVLFFSQPIHRLAILATVGYRLELIATYVVHPRPLARVR